jgi:PAS domain-containing protein
MPRSPKRQSLRRQLAWLIATLGLPLIALQGWWTYREYRLAEDAAMATVLGVADMTASGVRQFLQRTRDSLVRISDRFGPEYLRGECRESLENATAVYAFVVNLIVVSRDGAVVCSSLPAPANTVARDWEWFPRLEAGEAFVTGRPIEGTLSGTWVLPLVVPIRDEAGGFAGALVGSVPLLEFVRFVPSVRADADVVVSIWDGSGIGIAHSHYPERFVGRNVAEIVGPLAVLEPGRDIVRGADFAGVDRAWGHLGLENDWRVSVGIPAASVYGPVQTAAARNIAITAVILLLAVGLAGVGYRRMVEGLRELTSGMRLAGGGVTVALSENAPAEVESVVAQLNTTLELRRAAEAAERDARERYQLLFDNAVFGLCVATPEGELLEANPALATMLGYESVEELLAAGTDAVSPVRGAGARIIRDSLADGVIEGRELVWLRKDRVPVTVRINGKTIVM